MIPTFPKITIFHTFDPKSDSPGGIETCIRGIIKYTHNCIDIEIVGVDKGKGPESRKLGQFETYELGSREYKFLPVARIDATKRRLVPHAVKLVIGAIFFQRKLDWNSLWQAHRMDVALGISTLTRNRFNYFIHTQENGLTGKTSDSYWRFFGKVHKKLESWVVKKANFVVVFNKNHFAQIARSKKNSVFSPTWFDPELLGNNQDRSTRHVYQITWVGRLETPKDPKLSVEAFQHLLKVDSSKPWQLRIIGSGSLEGDLRSFLASLPLEVRERVFFDGSQNHGDVMKSLSNSGLFLMTSWPGYEGYPRVLVEALASGLPCVVTDGSDTGGLISHGNNGFITSRVPSEIASALESALSLQNKEISNSVSNLSAPAVLSRIFAHPAAKVPLP